MDSVSVHNLAVRYGDQIALAPISFDIPKGRLVFVVGPNGSGKSSLLTALLDLTPFQGEVKLLGRHASASYHEIGYVPQRFSFDRTIPLTVRELLLLSLAFCRCLVGDQDAHLTQALTDAGVSDLIDRPLSSLSGGQLQRVLLARALAHHPQLIILDEPEAGIDHGGELALYPLLSRLVREDGLTVLIASHELSAARRWADQVIAINGNLVADGPPTKVLTNQLIKQLFRS